MQIVDVLRDHGRRLAGAVEAGKRKVPATGPGGGKLRVHGKAPAPSFVAHLLAREELVERDRLILGPEPAGRAEIGNATLGGNSRSSERGDDARALHQLLQFVDSGLQVRRDHVCFVRSFSWPRRRTKRWWRRASAPAATPRWSNSPTIGTARITARRVISVTSPTRSTTFMGYAKN